MHLARDWAVDRARESSSGRRSCCISLLHISHDSDKLLHPSKTIYHTTASLSQARSSKLLLLRRSSQLQRSSTELAILPLRILYRRQAGESAAAFHLSSTATFTRSIPSPDKTHVFDRPFPRSPRHSFPSSPSMGEARHLLC